MTTATNDLLLRPVQLTGFLELICRELELTDTQRSSAEDRYNAIARWIDETPAGPLRDASLYPQGSFALWTTVKPLRQAEFDVDLVCHVPALGTATPPSALKHLVGSRLKEHGTYRCILEEKRRCWRINYADEFHLDITPSISNPACTNGGELVPDGEVKQWKATNPRGYRQWFEDHAALEPTLVLEQPSMRGLRADIEQLPVPTQLKGALRRTVQLCKRHRDVHFAQNPDSAPISIILTTLAARSYASCVQAREYDTGLDLLHEIIRGMPRHIEVRTQGKQRNYAIWNPTTHRENFAERWNSNASLPESFFQWQQKALDDLARLPATLGVDGIHKHLRTSLGRKPVDQAFNAASDRVSQARAQGSLGITSSIGISINGVGRRIRSNTFYGR